MGGEKSERGIVVKKPTGKVAKVGDFVLSHKDNHFLKRTLIAAKPFAHGRKVDQFIELSCTKQKLVRSVAVEPGLNRRVDRLGWIRRTRLVLMLS
ncbi:hypothetical protein BKP37_17355 [Anaerobacillus alkalilacustris]|uniref:Uncharacterized protein n=1 Tax=Anaerobacillus alkalilacustris TaxID=393763 RepID=A0A1S2LF71_9BACI|nr:hypothetical protein BKP37_17355 [Anaerobacillus alkalilacustris]